MVIIIHFHKLRVILCRLRHFSLYADEFLANRINVVKYKYVTKYGHQYILNTTQLFQKGSELRGNILKPMQE